MDLCCRRGGVDGGDNNYTRDSLLDVVCKRQPFWLARLVPLDTVQLGQFWS